jgi:hypothetical protein
VVAYANWVRAAKAARPLRKVLELGIVEIDLQIFLFLFFEEKFISLNITEESVEK